MNLKKILNDGYSGNRQIVLIETSEDSLAIADTVLTRLEKQYRSCTVKRYLADKIFSYQELIDYNNSGSLFEEKTLAIVKYNNMSRPTQDQAKELEILAAMLANPDRLVEKLIIVCEKFDYRQKKGKVYTQLLQYCDILIINDSRAELIDWAIYILMQQRLKIDNRALEYLLELNANNIPHLAQILLQLAYTYYQAPELESCYLINFNDINDFVNDNSKYNIFILSKAYLQPDLKTALNIFQELNTNAENTILMLWVMAEDVRKMLSIKAILQDNPMPTTQFLSSQLQVWGERLSSLLAASRRLSYQQLLEIFNTLAQVDLKQKGLISEPQDGLVQCLLKFAG